MEKNHHRSKNEKKTGTNVFCKREEKWRDEKKKNMPPSLLAAIDTSLKHLAAYILWIYISNLALLLFFLLYIVGLRRFGTCICRMCANII